MLVVKLLRSTHSTLPYPGEKNIHYHDVFRDILVAFSSSFKLSFLIRTETTKELIEDQNIIPLNTKINCLSRNSHYILRNPGSSSFEIHDCL